MNFQIYKILKSNYGSNSYSVCRNEKWTIHMDREFNDHASALRYVIDKNIKYAPEFFLDALIANKLERRDIMDKKYQYFHSYFIGKPPYNEIVESIKDKNVTHINE